MICVALFVIALSAPGAKAQRPVVAQLLNVRGNVQIRYHGEARPAQTCSRLRADDEIILAAHSQTDLLFNATGARFNLQGINITLVKSDRLLCLTGAKPRPLASINRALSTGIREDQLAAIEVRGQEEISHLEPQGAINSTMPRLQWQNTSTQPVTLTIRQNGVTKLMRTLPPGTDKFQIPARLLRRGVWYQWLLSVQDEGETQMCGSWIRVLQQGESANLQTAKREADRLRHSNPGDPIPDFLLAQTLQRLGYFNAARKAWDAALQKRPDDAGLAAMKQKLNGN